MSGATLLTGWPAVGGLAVLAYLFGSISSAITSCRLMGLPDPRTLGSGNPGATNVLRTGSKTAAIITLLGDAVKALLPILLARAVLADATQWQLLLIGACAFLGHLYPVYYGFKGGKGVSTAFGILLGCHWPTFLAAVLTWLLVASLSRYSALAALTAFALAPVYFLLLGGSAPAVVVLGAITLLIFWRHRGNIVRLYQGTESRIGKR